MSTDIKTEYPSRVYEYANNVTMVFCKAKFILVILTCFSLFCYGIYTRENYNIVEKDNEITTLKQEVSDLRSTNRTVGNELSSIKSSVEDLKISSGR